VKRAPAWTRHRGVGSRNACVFACLLGVGSLSASVFTEERAPESCPSPAAPAVGCCALTKAPVLRGASMLPRLNWRSWALPLAALLFGCAPKIGNRCTLSTDCSQIGDRLCDATQPEGYCTIFNCEPDTCPDSVCVGFNAQLDPACNGTDVSRTPRFERTFCMAPCSEDSDCRDSYKCADPKDDKFRVVDLISNPPGQKVCIAGSRDDKDAVNPAGSATTLPPVCGQGDPGANPWTPYTPDGGASGASSSSSSSSGMGGASSSSSSSSSSGGTGGAGGMGADGGP
jgi:uncharacterized membrane protein YgcG